MSTIFWDWNGTLFDDVDLCHEIMRSICLGEGGEAISLDTYRSAFGFPVQELYERLGMDVSQGGFKRLGEIFIRAYATRRGEVSLRCGARQALAFVASKGRRQGVFSAYQQTALGALIADHGLGDTFDEVIGRADLFASGKLDLGRAWCDSNPGEEVILIGDTDHDAEVAHALGWRPLLVCGGHQDRARLMASGAPVVSNLGAVASWLEANLT